MTVFRDIERLLLRELSSFSKELELFPDEETIWRTPPGVTNSAGTLALHIAGNVQHFVGGVLGRSGYVRDRQREFSERGMTREGLLDELRKASHAVLTVMPSLDPALYGEPFPITIVKGRHIPTGRFLLQLAVHAAFHLGQVGYLRRTLTGDVRSTDPVSVAAICDELPDSSAVD